MLRPRDQPGAPKYMVNPCAQCGRRTKDPKTGKLIKCSSSDHYTCATFQKTFSAAWEKTALFLIRATGMDPRKHHPHPAEHHKEYPPHPDEKPEEPEGGTHDKQ